MDKKAAEIDPIGCSAARRLHLNGLDAVSLQDVCSRLFPEKSCPHAVGAAKREPLIPQRGHLARPFWCPNYRKSNSIFARARAAPSRSSHGYLRIRCRGAIGGPENPVTAPRGITSIWTHHSAGVSTSTMPRSRRIVFHLPRLKIVPTVVA